MLPDEVHETNIDTVPHLVQWDRPGRPWGREPVSVMGKTTGVYFCKVRDFWYIIQVRKGKQQCIVLVDIYTSVYQRRKGFVVVNSPWFPGEVKYWTLAEKSSIICRNRSPLWESNYKIIKTELLILIMKWIVVVYMVVYMHKALSHLGFVNVTQYL